MTVPTADRQRREARAAYLAVHRERHQAQLAEFVSFASISVLPEHAAEVRACAEWLVTHLRAIGFEHAELLETTAHPIVHAAWMGCGADAPTVIIYGHYDVQPVDPLAEWTTPPFDATVRDGNLYGRGASDNKGPIFANLTALEALLAVDGGLPCNVRVLIEGEEEYRSEGFSTVLTQHAKSLDADLAIVSDVTLFARGEPSLTVGLRGFVALEIELRGARTDLHSGLFGGAAPNPLHALAGLLAGLHDPRTARVMVPGFYDRVRPPDPVETASWRALPFDERAFLAEIGIQAGCGEAGFSTLERLWARPTLEVHGVWGGFTKTGLKTVIPSSAHAKLSCRLVPHQDPDEILGLVREHLAANVPSWCRLHVAWDLVGTPPIAFATDHPAVAAACAALRDAYGREPSLLRSGWSVPAAEAFRRVLGLDCLLLGFGAPTDNAHAPNEHFSLDDFHAGIRTMVALWPRLASVLTT